MSPGRALLAFALGAAFFAYAFLLRVQPSVVVPDLMRDFAVGAGALGGLSAMYFYAYAVVQIPVGMLLDRFGPRRLMSAALLVCAAGSAVFAFAQGLEMAAFGRLLVGAGAAFGFLGTMVIVAQWMPAARFGLYAGILQMVGMAGGVLGQAPFRWLVEESGGWRPASLYVAYVGAVLAVAIYLVVRDRARPKDSAAPAPGRAPTAGALRNPVTWAAAAMSFLLTASLLAFAGLWAVPFLEQGHGLAPTHAAGLVSLFFVGWGVGSVSFGYWSDAIGRRKPPLLSGAALCALAMGGFVHVADPGTAFGMALLALAGMGGSTMILSYAVAREANDPRASGAAMGVINMATVGSGAVMQPVLGWLLDLRWDGALVDGAAVYDLDAYRVALSFLPLGAALAFLICLVLPETGPRGTPRRAKDRIP